jgi:hypothetical protein
MQVAATISGGDGSAAGAASAGYGKDLLFGIVTAAFGAERIALDVAAGSDQPVTPDNLLRACPIVSIGMSSHHDEIHLRLTAGGRASYLAVNSSRVLVIPTIGLQFRSEGAVAFFEIEGGVGFVRRPFAVRPSVIQRAGDVSAARVQISVSVGF